jgi:type II secretory pathway component PulK
MKMFVQTRARGIALIIVMLVIVALGVLAAELAYLMKVEMKLARNVDSEGELEWLGRSGVELARYVLAQQLNIPAEAGFAALNQKWAGGTGGTNDLLADVSLENNQLGRGKFSVRIIDMERKVNLNFANRQMIQQALESIGVDSFDASTILDSIEDWTDPNSDPHLNGAESDYYLNLPQPYVAKNGPFDDISELLLLRGITPEIYWGPAGTDRSGQLGRSSFAFSTGGPDTTFSFGLVDLFTAVGRRAQININTAPVGVLQLLPGIDRNLAEGIVKLRAGLDGVDGTEDDTPLHSPGEMINVPGMIPTFVSQMTRYATVQSSTFEARVDVEIDHYKKRLVALLVRNGPRDVQVLNMHWE